MWRFRLDRHIDQSKARTRILSQFRLIVAYAAHVVMRRFKTRVCDQDDLCVVAIFQTLHPFTFFVQKVGGHFNRQLRDHFGSAFFAGFFADDAQDGKRQ